MEQEDSRSMGSDDVTEQNCHTYTYGDRNKLSSPPYLSPSYFGSLCFIQPLQTDDFLSFTSHPGVPPFWDPCPPHFSGPITHSSSSSAPCSLCSFRCCRQMRMPVAATAVAMMAAMMPPMMPPVAPAPAVLGVSARRGTV